jgi:mono/diheme cytochrome c family protein
VTTGRAALRLLLPLLVLAVAAPARAADTEAGTSPLAGPGQALFVRHCAVCHGRSGTGDGPFRGVLTVPPADLTRIAARRGGVFPADEIAAFVDGRFVPKAHGTREMPVWGRWLGQPMAPGVEPDDVTRGEILAIVTYLETLQR